MINAFRRLPRLTWYRIADDVPGGLRPLWNTYDGTRRIGAALVMGRHCLSLQWRRP